MKSYRKLGASLALAICALGSVVSLEAQNIQLHYDFGRYVHPTAQEGRPYITATVEQKSRDRWGDTFYFVDMNFLEQGAVQANWKFLRNLRFWDAPFSWHLRYDGGLRFVNAHAAAPVNRYAISFGDAFFTGATYHWRSADRKLMLNFTAAYKYIRHHDTPHNWEGTVIWNYAPGDGLFNATGFATLWQERDARFGTSLKFMSQPQFWLNLNRLPAFADDFGLSVGSEVRISRNVDAGQWVIAPTLALRWSFGK